jgi:hypothetical protein
MNDNLKNQTPNDGNLDEHLFDLLADGELPDEARRELLARLDREADGWRRCALAFLEAQAWRGETRSLVREATAPVVENPVADNPAENSKQPKVQRSRSGSTWLRLSPGTLWAMAASFLIAFLLGIGWRGGWGRTESGAQQETNQMANEPAKTPDAKVATASVLPEDLKLVVHGGSQETPSNIELPVFEAGNLDPFWLENRPSPMPADVVRELEQLGHQVKQQRRMMRVNLEDGRQMIVPVDQVEVVPVKWQ